MSYKNIDDLLNGLDEKERRNYKKIKRYFGDKNYKENDGKGILHILVDEKHDENKCLLAIKSLIKYGFDVNMVDEFKYNFIQVAMYTGYSLNFVLEIIKLALENDLDVNHKDEDGDTMVHTAIYADDFDENVIEIYKLLLKNGFNSDAKDNDKLDLEQAATKQNQMSKEEIKAFNRLFAENSSKYKKIFENYGEIIAARSVNNDSINKDPNIKKIIELLASPTKITCVFENEKEEGSIYNSLAYEIENGTVPDFIKEKKLVHIPSNKFLKINLEELFKSSAKLGYILIFEQTGYYNAKTHNTITPEELIFILSTLSYNYSVKTILNISESINRGRLYIDHDKMNIVNKMYVDYDNTLIYDTLINKINTYTKANNLNKDLVINNKKELNTIADFIYKENNGYNFVEKMIADIVDDAISLAVMNNEESLEIKHFVKAIQQKYNSDLVLELINELSGKSKTM